MSRTRAARTTVPAQQPAVPFQLVDLNGMLSDSVDVAEAHLQHAPVGRGGETTVGALTVKLVQTPLQKTPMPDSVSSDQSAYGHIPLGQPSGVLLGCYRPFDIMRLIHDRE